MLPKIAYSVLGIPAHYHGITYTDTNLSKIQMDKIVPKINKAPASGILLISGTAAPVVNHLMESRKVVGLNFVDYYSSKLSNEENMDAPKAPVVIIHGIGSEPANNPQFASKILGALLNNYKNSLVILETDKTVSNFQTSYSISIANTLNIPQKEVEKWI